MSRQENILKKTVLGTIVSVGLMAASTIANAAPTFVGFPAPGDEWFSFSGSGSPGHPGGSTWSFSSVDLTGFDELYYGLNPAFPTQLRLDNPTGGGGGFLPENTMTISSIGGTSATWTGSSVLPSAFHGLVPVTTRMVVTLTGAASFVDAATVDILEGPAVGAVVEVLGDFSYKREIQFFDPGLASFVPYLSGYDAHPTLGPAFEVIISQGHGFYAVSSEEAVPAPGALLLLGFGLIGLGAARRKAA